MNVPVELAKGAAPGQTLLTRRRATDGLRAWEQVERGYEGLVAQGSRVTLLRRQDARLAQDEGPVLPPGRARVGGEAERITADTRPRLV